MPVARAEPERARVEMRTRAAGRICMSVLLERIFRLSVSPGRRGSGGAQDRVCERTAFSWPARNFRSFARSFGSVTARMATASRAAFTAPAFPMPSDFVPAPGTQSVAAPLKHIASAPMPHEDFHRDKRLTTPGPTGENEQTRLASLLGPEEHEMHHRGQLMLIERILGIVPHLTRQRQERALQHAWSAT